MTEGGRSQTSSPVGKKRGREHASVEFLPITPEKKPVARSRGGQTSSPVVTIRDDEIPPETLLRETAEQSRFHSSSPAPGVTTRGQTTKQTTQELATKSLHLCLASYDGSSVSYAVLACKPAKGGTSSYPMQEFHEVQFPSSDDGNCLGMGCGISGSKLFLLGGRNPVSDYSSSRVFKLNLANSEHPYGASEAPEMLSGMASPLIITVKKKPYVLARTPVSMLPDCPFMVHEPRDKKEPWKKLPSPPFLIPNSKFFQDPQILSYVVIGNKIHVSTSSSSFTFDTTTEKWMPCSLFDRSVHRKWKDSRYPSNCGIPFNFDGRAIMYDDNVMICLDVSAAEVFAHKLVDGKAMEKQVLRGLEFPPDATSTYLADYEEGYLCLLHVPNNDPPKQDYQIFITLFQVSESQDEIRLKSKTNHTFKVSPPSTEPDKFWSPISCFVM